jgi:hypothetical protein
MPSPHQHEKYYCHQCSKIIIGGKEWKDHLKSKGHRMKKRRKKEPHLSFKKEKEKEKEKEKGESENIHLFPYEGLMTDEKK